MDSRCVSRAEEHNFFELDLSLCGSLRLATIDISNIEVRMDLARSHLLAHGGEEHLVALFGPAHDVVPKVHGVSFTENDC